MTNESEFLEEALRDTASSVLVSLRRSHLALGYTAESNILFDPRLDRLVRARMVVQLEVAEAIRDSIAILTRLDAPRHG